MKDTYYCSVCKKTLTANDGVFVHEDIVHPDDMLFDSEEQQPIALYTGNYTIGFLNSDKTLKVGEPLYTAPRELSDEEILKVCLDGGHVDCIADVDLEIDGMEELKHQYLRLCRAILKKASENV